MAASNPSGPFGFVMPQGSPGNFVPFYFMDPSGAASTAGMAPPHPAIPGGQMIMMMPMMSNNTSFLPQQEPLQQQQQQVASVDHQQLPHPAYYFAPYHQPHHPGSMAAPTPGPPPSGSVEPKTKPSPAHAREDDESSITSASSISSRSKRKKKHGKRGLSRSQVLELFAEFVKKINPDYSSASDSETDRESSFECVVGVKKGKLRVLKNFTPSSEDLSFHSPPETPNESGELEFTGIAHPEPRIRNSASVPRVVKEGESLEERCQSVPSVLVGPPPDVTTLETVQLKQAFSGDAELRETSARSLSRISAMLQNFGQEEEEADEEESEQEFGADMFEPAAFSSLNYNEEVIGEEEDSSVDALEEGIFVKPPVVELDECEEVEEEVVGDGKFDRKPQTVTVTVTRRARRRHLRLSREDEQRGQSAEPPAEEQVEPGRSGPKTVTFTALKVPDSDSPYQCSECGKCFKQLRYFKCHAISLHNGQDCHLCGANILGRFRFRRHLSKVHGIGAESAPGLAERKESRVRLVQPNETDVGGASGNVEPTQEQQQLVVRKERRARAHKNQLDGIPASILDSLGPVNVFSCNSCPEIFPTAAKLKWHVDDRHAITKLPCRICSVAFSHRALLNRHYTTVHPESDFAKAVGGTKCKVCGKIVKNMTLHRALHSSTKPWKCNVCGRGFGHKCNLQAHMFTHKKAEDRPFICNICGAGFLRESHLNDHKAAHRVPGRGIQPKVLPKHLLRPRHMCYICDRGFFLRRNLARHLIHHAAPPEKKHFPCLRCDRVFTNVEYLKTHMSVHSDVRPYRCSECTRSFRWRANLKSHMQRTHRPIQPAAEH